MGCGCLCCKQLHGTSDVSGVLLSLTATIILGQIGCLLVVAVFWDPDRVFDTVRGVMPLTMPQDGGLTIGHEILRLTRSGAPLRYHAEVFDSEAGCVHMGKDRESTGKATNSSSFD